MKSLAPIPALVAAVFLAGCAGSGHVSSSGTEVGTEIYQAAVQRVDRENVRPELRSYYIALYSEGRQNSVLHAMNGGLTALRLADYTAAKDLFDRAIQEVEAMQGEAEQAKRAQSKFVGEKEKWFKGEPYERSALYFYRGTLYLRDGDYDNAAACFRRAQIEDITSEDKPGFAGDWQSCEDALAVASFWAGRPQDAKDAFHRIDGFGSKTKNLLRPDETTNLLVMVETGNAPIKYREGSEGEKLAYSRSPSKIVLMQATVGEVHSTTGFAENLYFQATTRGNRKMDEILSDKADFKKGTGLAAAGLGAGTLASSQVDKSGYVTAGLAAATLTSAILSLTSDAKADIRSWMNLPDTLFLIPLHAEPGQKIQLTAFSSNGQELTTVPIQAPATETRQVVFVRINL